MAVTPPLAFTPYEANEVEECVSSSSGTQLRRESGTSAKRRRHSFFIPRRKSIVNHILDTEEGILLKVCFRRQVWRKWKLAHTSMHILISFPGLKVDIFLSELERRLEFLD